MRCLEDFEHQWWSTFKEVWLPDYKVAFNRAKDRWVAFELDAPRHPDEHAQSEQLQRDEKQIQVPREFADVVVAFAKARSKLESLNEMYDELCPEC